MPTMPTSRLPLFLLSLALLGLGVAVYFRRSSPLNQLPWERIPGLGADKVEAPPALPDKKAHRKTTETNTTLKGTAGMDPDKAWLAPAEPKPCLAGPSEADLPEEGTVSGKGLELGALRSAMSAAATHALPCFADAPTGAITFDIVAGCDGRVSKIRVAEDGGYPSDVLGCAVEVLRNASLPAHDLPDGQEFSYPLSYEAP